MFYRTLKVALYESAEQSSPNHEELLSLYSYSTSGISRDKIRNIIEEIAGSLLVNPGVGENGGGIIAIRCGELGSCIGTRGEGMKWISPSHSENGNRGQVIDVTGGE